MAKGPGLPHRRPTGRPLHPYSLLPRDSASGGLARPGRQRPPALRLCVPTLPNTSGAPGTDGPPVRDFVITSTARADLPGSHSTAAGGRARRKPCAMDQAGPRPPTQNSGSKVRRPRAARACDACRVKKNKCDDLYPCTYCRSQSAAGPPSRRGTVELTFPPQITISSASTEARRQGGGSSRQSKSWCGVPKVAQANP